MLNRLIQQTIDSGARHRVSSDDLLDGVLPNIGDTRAKATAFWVLLVCSSIIAAAGVITNSTAVVIGAMVIAPLGTPMYGIAAGLVTGFHSRPAFFRVLTGSAAAIAIGAIVDFATIERLAVEANPQILARTSPSLVDLGVAFATGIAGSMALVRSDISPALPGVAIAISLVPPLTVVGITLAQGEMGLAFGAALLFVTNMLAIILAGIIIFRGANLSRPFSEDWVPPKRAGLTLAIGSVVVVTLLLAGTVHSARLLQQEHEVKALATEFADEQPNWELASVERRGTPIVVTFIGEGSAAPQPSINSPGLKKLRGSGVELIVEFETGARLTF